MSTFTAALARQGMPSARRYPRIYRTVKASCLASALAFPAVQADEDSARAAGAAWLIKSQRGDGSWITQSGELPVQATSASLLALRRAGQSRSPTYVTGAAWLANADADSVDSISRKIEALSYTGHVSVVQTEARRLESMSSIAGAAVWGGYGSPYSVDYMDIALGLSAMRLGHVDFAQKVYDSNYVNDAVCVLVEDQIAVATGKRAWPMAKVISKQQIAQGRPSVMATTLLATELRALQSSMTSAISFSCPGVGAVSLSDMISQSVSWLLDQQNPDGGYGERRTDGSKGTSSVLVTALVLKALRGQVTVPQPAVNNAKSWLLNQQNATTGSWEADPLVTASVLNSMLPASGANLTDTDKDGLTDSVENKLGGNSSVTDAREQLGSPTLGGPGTTAPGHLLGATVGQPFSHDLGSQTSYAISSGALPPGLQLNGASGLISGTPTQAGSYGFQFKSAGGDVSIARIDVVRLEDSGDTPLPAWALVMFSAALFGVLRRQRAIA
jgi:Putative Ig domain/Prenyltransferase and squalene oxidase repeat